MLAPKSDKLSKKEQQNKRSNKFQALKSSNPDEELLSKMNRVFKKSGLKFCLVLHGFGLENLCGLGIAD